MARRRLADAALKALEGRNACLLANHGMIVVGPTLKKAMWLAVEVETLAAQYWRALCVGKPNILSDAQIKTVARQVQDLRAGRRAGARLLLRTAARGAP